jgi:hypothetical protein
VNFSGVSRQGDNVCVRLLLRNSRVSSLQVAQSDLFTVQQKWETAEVCKMGQEFLPQLREPVEEMEEK